MLIENLISRRIKIVDHVYDILGSVSPGQLPPRLSWLSFEQPIPVARKEMIVFRMLDALRIRNPIVMTHPFEIYRCWCEGF